MRFYLVAIFCSFQVLTFMLIALVLEVFVGLFSCIARQRSADLALIFMAINKNSGKRKAHCTLSSRYSSAVTQSLAVLPFYTFQCSVPCFTHRSGEYALELDSMVHSHAWHLADCGNCQNFLSYPFVCHFILLEICLYPSLKTSELDQN